VGIKCSRWVNILREAVQFLPVSQLTENIVYQTHITRFSVLPKREIHSRYTHPNIGSINQKRRLFKVKVSFMILDIFG
jgi:hypothetical protein